ncbi:MAG TPA: outer membrane lipoprotein-sorting protein [Candidatus Dormibacteraeota bacterium]|nr:outer membrane lipoprotein-sorting protein [Candidatus Dormibacteraeota bacterium]
MIRLRVPLAISAVLVAFATSQAAVSQAPQPVHWTTATVLAWMDKSAQGFHSLTAHIEHVKYTAVVSDTSTESGDMFVRRDDKLRIDFHSPDKRTVLRNGDTLFVYTPKINRVEEYDLGKNRAMVDQYLLLGFGTRSAEVQKSYDVAVTGEEELDGQKVVVLELTPKSADVRRQITKIVMWVDEAKWLPLQEKFIEATEGDYFLARYTDLKENLKFPDSKFKQDWPKNAVRVKPQS